MRFAQVKKLDQETYFLKSFFGQTQLITYILYPILDETS